MGTVIIIEWHLKGHLLQDCSQQCAMRRYAKMQVSFLVSERHNDLFPLQRLDCQTSKRPCTDLGGLVLKSGVVMVIWHIAVSHNKICTDFGPVGEFDYMMVCVPTDL